MRLISIPSNLSYTQICDEYLISPSLFKTNKPDPFIRNFKALFTSSISIYFTLSSFIFNLYVLRPRAYLINIIIF